MLRIFVYSLLLANILLITMRMLQPEPETPPAVIRMSTPVKKLPTIELVEVQSSTSDSATPVVIEQPEQSVEPQEQPMPEAGPMACIRVGPFETIEEYATLENELNQLFDRVQTRESRSIVDKGYWVYLQAYDSRAQASQVMKALTSAGARDFYIVPEGSMQNAISLGVYDRRQSAERRREQLNNLGLTMDFMIEPQTEIETRYYLEAGPVNALNPTLIELSYNNPDTAQIQIDCSSGEILPMSNRSPGG